jgi:hypothetical protein
MKGISGQKSQKLVNIVFEVKMTMTMERFQNKISAPSICSSKFLSFTLMFSCMSATE